MPVDWTKYPKDWKQIALKIKDKADWHCKECGKPCRRIGESWEDFKASLPPEWLDHFYGDNGKEKRQRFTLTVAHLDHQEHNCAEENLKALCSVCHLRYDQHHHARNRKRKSG